MATQLPVSPKVAAVLGMTTEECEKHPTKAARKAAAKLRNNGYARRYCHLAWERGYRWYYLNSSVPEPDYCATSLLGMAINEGRITK